MALTNNHMVPACAESPLFTVRVIGSDAGPRKRRITLIRLGPSDPGTAQIERCRLLPRAGSSRRKRRTPTTSDRPTCVLLR